MSETPDPGPLPRPKGAVTHAALRRYRRILSEHPGIADSVRALPNIAYVSIGEKRVGGKRTGRAALIAYVYRKNAELAEAERVPPEVSLGGDAGMMATDVVELHGYPTVFGARAGTLLRAFDGDIGTCGYVLQKGAQRLLITNAHVVTDARTGAAGLVGALDRDSNLFRPAGDVLFASPLRWGMTVSADIAAVSAAGVESEPGRILDIGAPVSRIADIDGDPRYIYWYSVNGTVFYCGSPGLTTESVSVEVDGGSVDYTQFWHFDMLQGAAGPGQSGALLCRTENGAIVACGLVFGGIPPSTLYAFSLRQSLALLG